MFVYLRMLFQCLSTNYKISRKQKQQRNNLLTNNIIVYTSPLTGDIQASSTTNTIIKCIINICAICSWIVWAIRSICLQSSSSIKYPQITRWTQISFMQHTLKHGRQCAKDYAKQTFSRAVFGLVGRSRLAQATQLAYLKR